jgi:parallel beta-helix repeat protein
MRFFRPFLLLFVFLGCITFNVNAGTWYVSTTGSDTTGNGTSGNPWQTIQYAINQPSVAAGDVISVAAGTYNESINVSRSVTLTGAGIDSSIIIGSKTVAQSVLLAANNIIFEGFTVKRDGNNLADWVVNANTSGIIFGQTKTGITVRNCKITENRNGLYLNNTQGHTITGNIITNNRTGIQLTNNVSGCIITNNIITGNWTHGFVLYYGSTGQPASTGVHVNHNNISGNWYSQLECKTVVANTTSSYDFTNNWWGSAALNVTNTPAGEPGYTEQIPVQFGGAAVNPGGNEAKICGDLIELVDYDPYWTVNYLSDKPVLSYPVNGSAGHPSKPRLEWDTFPGAWSYDIEISKGQPFSSATSIYYNTTGLYFDIPGELEVSSVYYWRVRARGINEIDSSLWSDTWNFATTESGVSETGEPVLTYPVLNTIVYDVNPGLYWYMVPVYAGITLYEIEYKEGDDDFSSGEIQQLTSAAANVQVSGLTGGAVYYWRVRAYNGGKNLYSAWSDIESFTVTGTLSNAPVKPVASYPNNNVTINYDNTPALYWYVIAPVNDFNYEVIIENAVTSAVVFTGTTAAGATSVEPGTPLTGGEYRWKVRSLKTGFEPSAWSDYAYFTIESTASAAPQVPVPTYPVDNATVYTSAPAFCWYVTNYSPEFTWNLLVQGVSSQVAGYSRTYTSTGTYFQWPEDLTPGEQYQWSVRTNHAGYASSDYSIPELFTVYANVQSAARPTPSWPVNNTTLYVNPPALYWYTTSAAIGVTYNIQLQPASVTLEGSPVIATGISNLYYQLTGSLTPGTSYHWRVQSVLNGVASDWSAEAAFTMNSSLAASLPQPALIYPVNLNVYTTSPIMTWYNTYSASITGYVVTIATDPSLTEQVAGSPFAATAAYFIVSGLVPGATYYWGVQSTDGSSYSLMSAIGQFTVEAGSAPVVPRLGGPDGIDLHAASAMLSWYLPVISDAELTYDLEYSTSADFANSTVKEGIQAASYYLSGLKGNTEYYWRVRSSAGGNALSGYSLAGSFKTSGVTAVEGGATVPEKFEVAQNYPNPFNPVTNISVNLPENAQLTVKIYNILGQEVKTLVNREMTAGSYVFMWNGDNNAGNKAPSGTYIYKVTAGENTKSLKMILLK